jgi:putative transposase
LKQDANADLVYKAVDNWKKAFPQKVVYVKGMVKNRKLALAVSDVGLGEFIRQIEYKSTELGGKTQRVGRFYASSKTCNDCGHIHQDLTLTDRKWTCQGCGTVHQRDWNAAKNIEQEALRLACA